MRLAVTFAIAALGAATPAQSFVYDNLAPNGQYPTWFEFAGGSFPDTIGDEIDLGGTARQITQIEVMLTSPIPVEPVTVAIFANDGLGGAPGTRLWDSGLVPIILSSGATAFSIPNILVPNRITVAIQNNRLTQVGPGQNWAAHSPASIGSSPNYVWRGNAFGAWSQHLATSGPNDLAMRVSAVPEPLTLAALGLGLLAFRRRRVS